MCIGSTINKFVTESKQRESSYSLLVDNLDELDLSKILKSKIKDRDDLGKDERVGRRVIFEFNKS
ncbi:hypothetical protein [Rossellomorea aquimaris]|uniref:hypothetical protein n=1 Tax=Rossellomorea aquimaris TaxID=189382 RepID=UPI001653A33F|nr:hypothetical protein [Rossellomorea aquimaris]